MWFLALGISSAAPAGDMTLHHILIEGENWEMVSEGHQFADGCCADAEGNFYFTDVAKGTTINKIGVDGKLSVYAENAPKISGLKFGPDGRIYACSGGEKKIMAFDKEGKMTIIAEDVQPNDLVVNHNGNIYFTETGKKQVTLITSKGEKRVVDTGIAGPNGITLSPDQGTLAVSDYKGANVYTFRVEADGSLSSKEPYMPMRLPPNKLEANGDGMTTDLAGRWYVCTALGIQAFDPTGRLIGLIFRPQEKFAANLTFAGPDLQYLYVACSDKIYRRKTQAKGALFFLPPATPAPAKK